MSAYNRKVLKKMCSSSSFDATDCGIDESGYASFKALHNSTVEAPFLFDRDCETENCRNASNTTAIHSKSDYSSLQFQTPGNLSNNMSQFRKSSFSLTDASEDASKFSQLMSTKRRKLHCQAMAHHSSPKKSKKKLFPLPAQLSICRTRYYDGIEQLDIVGKLSNTQPALECILQHVGSHTLDVMTRVSECWALAVQKSQRAMERLRNHRFKLSLSKENAGSHPRMKGHPMQSKKQIAVPFNPSNAIHKPNQTQVSYKHTPLQDNAGPLVEQMQRIKCPRCGKCSRVFYCQVEEQQTPQTMPQHRIAAALSQTLPNNNYVAFSETKPSLTRFYSMDEMSRSSPPPPYSVGECTSVLCKFRFCVECCGLPHPGKKCLVTEMGTPSKIMMPAEKVTPPKRNQKTDFKLSRKKSLKRLNF
ncbi:uncharacterized protein LOC6566888 [Drosophila grimshawi]|uniref:GH13716 n=1 Tax=Drosophila grimshawi TaxID=7222 RepID=B4JQK8_DROGR|nr:uncharacterized protein LOC6566888 [Drosophila grimshawi]EDV99188.1 GH13716 [Drosophila grimshawi]